MLDQQLKTNESLINDTHDLDNTLQDTPPNDVRIFNIEGLKDTQLYPSNNAVC